MTIDKDFLAGISRATFRKSIGIGLENARANKPFIKKTIKDLAHELKDDAPKPALVISGGPSLHSKKQLAVIKEEGFNGLIVAADGSIGHCLRHGIIPHFVLTVDPDPHRIIRWFGDPHLEQRPEDDYFRRQDIDPELNEDEERKNRETLELVNKFGPEIKLIISTSVSPEISVRTQEAGMSQYWWNPLYDEFDDDNSHSRRLNKENKAPCMVTGGNVGSSCWAFAQAILRSSPVIMVGMDFSYPPGTNVYNTQYFKVFEELFPDAPESGLFEVENPHLDEKWITDPAYYWYSKCFLDMVEHAPGHTINCTEGGILFGKNIEWCSLRTALQQINSIG